MPKKKMIPDLVTDPEFESYIPPISQDESEQKRYLIGKQYEATSNPQFEDLRAGIMNTCYLSPDTPVLQYFQFPEFLLDSEMSQTAKILYMILYDRARLSQKNHWIDEDQRIYLIYPITELAKTIGRSISAVKSGLNELLQVDLLEKRKVGFGKPNRLYIKVPSENSLSEWSENSPSKRQKPDLPTGGKQPPNQLNITNNNITNNWRSNRSFSNYTGKRSSPFESYDYKGEDSL